MKRIKMILLCMVAVICCHAQINKSFKGDLGTLFCQAVDRHSLIESGKWRVESGKWKMPRKEKAAEPEFIFDPQGEEKMYCMSVYCYDQRNQAFAHAQSLKSQVRYDDDGKTVYFKDITKSLGVMTWLKGEIDGDTIKVPIGQPLAYYKGKYLIYFVPMDYDEVSGEMIPLDDFKLIIKGDSLVSPTFQSGHYQAAAGYVIISETTQGSLSWDVNHGMQEIKQEWVKAPEDVKAEEYVFSYENSYGRTVKQKVNVKKKDEDLYMQLSTCAPEQYIYGQLRGDSIYVPSCQVITDSTFIYYYALADPVYEGGELTDFFPVGDYCRLKWNPVTKSINTASDDVVFSVDYLDGLERCMNYVTDPRLERYQGNKISKPIAPELRQISLTDFFNNVVFNLTALDVDSNYINKDSLYYRVYFNDSLFTFTPNEYKNVNEPMTDVPNNFKDGYDFFVNGIQHTVYIYRKKAELQSIGVQSVYKVNGQVMASDIARYEVESDSIVAPADSLLERDLMLKDCYVVNRMVRGGEKITVKGTVVNGGKQALKGAMISYSTSGVSDILYVAKELAKGAAEPFEITIYVENEESINNVPIVLNAMPLNENGNEIIDENMENNSDTLHFSVYDETYGEKVVLLEEFTAESCGWCPYGAYRIETAIKESNLQDKVMWVCHHEGFGVDWLTIPESTEYTELYGGNMFAPAWMIDRNRNYSDEAGVVFSIPDIDEIKVTLDNALAQPCFVKLESESRVEDGKAIITVKAEKSFSFDGQCPEAYITVFVVEDGITPKKQKCYDNHPLNKHHNALRAVLTPTWGQLVEWDGNEMTASFEYAIPDGYMEENIKIVAFLHDNNSSINERTVFNTSFCSVSQQQSGIASVGTVSDNTVCPAFNIAGQRVNTSYKGIKIERKNKRFCK